MKNALQIYYQIILPCKGFLCVRSKLTGCVVPDVPIQASIYWYTNMAVMRRNIASPFPRPSMHVAGRKRQKEKGKGGSGE